MSTQITIEGTETEIHAAVQAFAEVLAGSPEFQAFEEAAVNLNGDQAARQAVRLFQEKQRSQQMMQRLGAFTREELDELKNLWQVMLGFPTVSAHLRAQEALVGVCQVATQEISRVIDLDYCNTCVPGCCG